MSDHRWKPVGSADCVMQITGADIEELEAAARESGYLIIRLGEGGRYIVTQLHDCESFIGPLARGEGLICSLQTSSIFGPDTLFACLEWVEDQRGIFLV